MLCLVVCWLLHYLYFTWYSWGRGWGYFCRLHTATASWSCLQESCSGMPRTESQYGVSVGLLHIHKQLLFYIVKPLIYNLLPSCHSSIYLSHTEVLSEIFKFFKCKRKKWIKNKPSESQKSWIFLQIKSKMKEKNKKHLPPKHDQLELGITRRYKMQTFFIYNLHFALLVNPEFAAFHHKVTSQTFAPF